MSRGARRNSAWTNQGCANFSAPRSKPTKSSSIPDLARDIRPQLDRLADELLDALRQAEPALHRDGAAGAIQNAASNSVMMQKYPEATRIALQPVAARAGRP